LTSVFTEVFCHNLVEMKKKNSWTNKRQAIWFRIVSIILVMFGLTYIFLGLKILPVHQHLVQWESALYGATMTGWGITLLLVGRVAFRQQSKELKQALFIGLAIWLVIEAIVSLWFGVWFNAGVDVAVGALFAIPLLRSR
jgi:Na+-translocating ferredoxin:NAD+ oxidoreductase RnfA subunit